MGNINLMKGFRNNNNNNKTCYGYTRQVLKQIQFLFNALS